MITIIKVDIQNEELLTNYAKLITAFASKNATLQESVTKEVERVISRTLFKGTTIQSNAGKISPDFLITNDNMNALLNTISGRAQIDIDRFNEFVSQNYGGKGNVAEAKILRADEQESGIKLGSYTPSLSTDQTRYFDFVSGNIIDTTKYSVLEELRRNFRDDPAAKPPAANSLPQSLKRADLMKFFSTTSPEFIKLVKNDQSVKALDKILSASPQTKVSSAQVTALVDKINDRWAQGSLDAQLTRLSQKDKLFDYILETPALKNQFYNKSQFLSIFRREGSKAGALLMHFPLSDFNNKFFGARLDGKSIKVFIKSNVEKEFLNQLSNETASVRLGDSSEEFERNVSKLAQNANFKNFKVNSFNTEIRYLVPTGGSIPMSSGNFFNVKRKYTRTPFLRTGNENLGKYAGLADAPAGKFLSSEYLSLVVRQKVIREMPHGPIGGKPLSDTMLTYRSGRFANSIQLLVNYRTRVVRYYYNPIYYIHETTSRNPQDLISRNISEVMRERFGYNFNITDRV